VVAKTHMVTYAISRERLLRLAHESPLVREGIESAFRERYGADSVVDVAGRPDGS